MYKGNKRESVFKEVWWVVHIMREAKVVGVRVWIMTPRYYYSNPRKPSTAVLGDQRIETVHPIMTQIQPISGI